MKPSIVVSTLSLVIFAACSAPNSPTTPTSNSVSAANSAPEVLSLPFKGSFEGAQTVTPGTPPFATVEVHASGQGTQLGRFQIELPHTVNFATSTATGICTIVAADGSTITASFTGQAQLGPIVTIVEQATISGGTGRFAGAAGSFTIHRTFDQAAGWTTGTFEGTIELAPGRP